MPFCIWQTENQLVLFSLDLCEQKFKFKILAFLKVIKYLISVSGQIFLLAVVAKFSDVVKKNVVLFANVNDLLILFI